MMPHDDQCLPGSDPGSALEILLDAAARTLSRLPQPVVIAACPNKHDDAGRFPDWLGVQVGRATWERSDYRLEGGDLMENTRNPEDLVAARDVLGWLQDSQWRSLFEASTNRRLGSEVLAVAAQHGKQWFVVSSSMDGVDLAYLIGSAGKLQFVGEAERLDERLGQTRPLILKRIDPESWPDLQAAVPAFPAEILLPSQEAAWQEAYTQLVELVRSGLLWMNTVGGTRCFISAASNEPSGGDFGYTPGGWRSIAANDASLTRRSYEKPEAFAERIKGQAAGGFTSIPLLDGLLNLLEAAKWRDLFSRTIMSLDRSNSLALMVRGSEGWVIAAETAVFALTPEGCLNLVGACDCPAGSQQAGRGTIHLFEGRSIAASEAQVS